MNKKTFKFPNDFYWGSAASAEQIEPNGLEQQGNKSETIWAEAFKQTSRFHNNKFAVNNFYKRYKEDLDLAKGLNFNSLRLSISWSRLVPDGVNVDPEAVKYYRDMIEYANKNGIEIFMGLFHFDMPVWAKELGGWTSNEVVEKFVNYAKIAFEELGDIVSKWATFNEPIVLVEGQYWDDFHPPFNLDFRQGIVAMLNIGKAHALSVKAFRESRIDTEIGVILNVQPAIPRSQNKADLEAARRSDLIQWRCYAESFVKGKFPQELVDLLKEYNLWIDKDINEFNEIFKDSKVDFLGINYYHPSRVKAPDYTPNFDENISAIRPWTHFFNDYEMPGRRMNPYRGWEINPVNIYDVLKTVQTEFNNIKCFIAENGMGVENEERYMENGMIVDNYRIDFHSEHLYWVHKAIEEGSNCVGYHMWTYIDNWSWLNAYKNRYGVISLNIENGDRTEKLSAGWMRELCKEGLLEYDDSEIKEHK